VREQGCCIGLGAFEPSEQEQGKGAATERQEKRGHMQGQIAGGRPRRRGSARASAGRGGHAYIVAHGGFSPQWPIDSTRLTQASDPLPVAPEEPHAGREAQFHDEASEGTPILKADGSAQARRSFLGRSRGLDLASPPGR